MTYRSKIFLAALGAAAAALAVAAGLVSWSLRRDLEVRLERTLVLETALAAETVEARAGSADFDAMAGDLARTSGARVTIIATDGRVVGDSDVGAAELEALENHADRPEVIAAGSGDVGIVRRYSTTLGYDMLYSARRLESSAGEPLGWVRLALPFTEIDGQVAAARRALWPGFGAAVAIALAAAWGISRQLTRRLRAIASAAGSRPGGPEMAVPAEGSDEIARVARLVNDSARALRAQLSAVAAEQALLSAILSGMVEGVVVVDDRGRVQLVNDAAQRMLGVATPQPPPGPRYLEVVRHPQVAEHLSRALQGETTSGTELVLHRDPDRTYVARAAPVVVPGGADGTSGAVLVLHDITDLRRADRVRRDFVANVSHELRTPLTAIRGYVEALLDDAGDPGQTRRFLEVVERHASRMERLVSDLLRLARLDAGQERIAAEPVALESMLSALESELAQAIERKAIAIDRRIATEAATVHADPAKLHDVLRNLLENAVNYSPDRGTVAVSAHAADERVVLQIDDEGPGIPPADLERVFERFYRVDKSRGTDPGGTGLGLAIVKHLVGLHGGTVTAENRPPHGARLTVRLPLRSAAAG